MIRLSREQVRSVDRICIDEYGLPGIVLMENAARSAAEAIDFHHRAGGANGTTATVVCGGGNNGGDGYAVARHLHNDGWHVTIVAVKPVAELAGDAAAMAIVAARMSLPIVDDLREIAGPPDVLLVDAVTGTGSTKPLRDRAADAVRAMNASGQRIVAIDVPSGLDCDTGEPLGDACVRAGLTVTFVAEKLGFADPRSREFTGDVVVGDIGCPREVIERARSIRIRGTGYQPMASGGIMGRQPMPQIHPTRLSVNVNKIATLRNTRPKINLPDLLAFARVALQNGAHGLTIHPRPDERHIRGADVAPIAALVAEFAGAEFNIEGNPFQGEFMDHCRQARPTQATLVPDDETQSTSDHGWDLRKDGERVAPIVAELKSLGIRVSLFLDPEPAMVDLAKDSGAHRIELYTEPYAEAFARGERGAAEAYAATARRAIAVGLGVNAGHDLNLDNLPPFLAAVPDVLEVSISHALTADALSFGFAATVRKYLDACAMKNS